ncbi:MAG: hypothetical protein F4X08_06085 [Gemmatimonadetes bacterium]|nr:hypothetical protein [Gemmatimonadota bacterium]MYD25361.1 hypothetical protein [Gemmatimonadota bacterium]MYI99695.1 hypothetical protein [Gemmatimonadota bacterium]
MRVLIIPEDDRKDQYILNPIFSQLLRSLGRPGARILVCQDPRLGGIGEALKMERISEIVARYRGMMDIFILCVDRDGEEGRRQRLDEFEAKFGDVRVFLAENAWEELETWVLAGLQLPANWNWNTLRAEVRVKEQYFEPLVDQRNLSDKPGGGREPLAEEASRRINAIRQKCPEDFDNLAQRLEAAIRNT